MCPFALGSTPLPSRKAQLFTGHFYAKHLEHPYHPFSPSLNQGLWGICPAIFRGTPLGHPITLVSLFYTLEVRLQMGS